MRICTKNTEPQVIENQNLFILNHNSTESFMR